MRKSRDVEEFSMTLEEAKIAGRQHLRLRNLVREGKVYGASLYDPDKFLEDLDDLISHLERNPKLEGYL
jgi:hypothetical protein